MDKKLKKTFNVFFDPYKAAGEHSVGGNDATPRGAFNEAAPDWFELPWRHPAGVRLNESNIPDELVGIPFGFDSVRQKKSNNGFDKKAYQREYMRRMRGKKSTSGEQAAGG